MCNTLLLCLQSVNEQANPSHTDTRRDLMALSVGACAWLVRSDSDYALVVVL